MDETMVVWMVGTMAVVKVVEMAALMAASLAVQLASCSVDW
jgi:hypothetical protein